MREPRVGARGAAYSSEPLEASCTPGSAGEMPMTMTPVLGSVYGAKKEKKSSGDLSVAAATVAIPSYSLNPLTNGQMSSAPVRPAGAVASRNVPGGGGGEERDPVS